jgi:hypothetical protein
MPREDIAWNCCWFRSLRYAAISAARATADGAEGSLLYGGSAFHSGAITDQGSRCPTIAVRRRKGSLSPFEASSSSRDASSVFCDCVF